MLCSVAACDRACAASAAVALSATLCACGRVAVRHSSSPQSQPRTRSPSCTPKLPGYPSQPTSRFVQFTSADNHCDGPTDRNSGIRPISRWANQLHLVILWVCPVASVCTQACSVVRMYFLATVLQVAKDKWFVMQLSVKTQIIFNING